MGFLITAPSPFLYAQGAAGGVAFLEPGQPPVVVHATVEAASRAHGNGGNGHHGGGGGSGNNLFSHGGSVETTPHIYLVFWGSQWNNNDPRGEAGILANFYSGVGGSSWLNSVVQYCQGVASGTVFCNGAGTPAGNQLGMFANANVWYDNSSAAPTHPTQSQLAGEAVNAAAHFGNTSAANNASAQYVIATATGNNASGFGTQYCAWHSSTSSTYKRIILDQFAGFVHIP
jgi:serine protease